MTDRTPLTNDERTGLGQQLPDWQVEGQKISRTFLFADFAEAWTFMKQVAVKAEDLQHHPDWSNSWNQVTIEVTTHSAGSLTRLDVAFAEAVEELL
ncbi:MAG: 4a-hydroxytetrahydrobiopterin dehydratase [Acidimicrobiales bacterium]|nr:4a-hydroxytetrahydrobiopterin dehydratase [Acidimicrobiales bacterium]